MKSKNRILWNILFLFFFHCMKYSLPVNPQRSMHRDGKVRAILKKTMKPQRSSAYLVRSLKRSEMLQCYSLLLPVAVLIIIFC